MFDQDTFQLEGTNTVIGGFEYIVCSSNISDVTILIGRGDIAGAARSLARGVRRGDLAASAIGEGELEGALSANRGLPDPDLLVRLGRLDSNLGFLPWQMRLTEIHGIPGGHRGVRADEVLRVLCKYSKCEQRFGT